MARFGVRLRNMFILGFKQLQDPYYQGFAAQIAFYLLLSIVPIILLVTQILGVFDISIASALSLFESYTGHKIPTIMEKLFEFSSAGYGNIIFLVIALWAGSRASFSIMRITNYTMTGGQSTGRNYFVERIRSIRTMIVTIITVVFAIVILVYGELILEMVLGLLKIDAAKYEDSIWMWLRWAHRIRIVFSDDQLQLLHSANGESEISADHSGEHLRVSRDLSRYSVLCKVCDFAGRL